MSQCLTNMNILFVRVFPTITHAHSVTMIHLNPHEVCKILMKPVAAVLSLTPASCSNSPSKLNWDLLWVEKLSELHSHTCEGHTENNAKGSSSLWHGVLSLTQSAFICWHWNKPASFQNEHPGLASGSPTRPDSQLSSQHECELRCNNSILIPVQGKLAGYHFTVCVSLMCLRCCLLIY